ncbi:MAG: glycosyltransferase family 2 protein [Clostridia bacterium]|nr:glycosyltransferase family 2 protein [Clostridia bacterium]
MDKISIITTYYNAKEFIVNAINSVYSQIGDPKRFTVEYILVNDKSPDNSEEIIDNYIANTPIKDWFEWKKVEPENNLGCGGARKFGIENATGNYFMFLDADDYYMHRDFILRAYNDITSKDADIVEYGIIYNQANGSQTPSVAPKEIAITNRNLAELCLFKDNLIKFNVWSKIYRRSIVESYTYSDERTFEDVRTIPVWVWNAKKIIIMPTAEINYRAATGSIIRNNWVETRIGTITAIASHFERFKDDYELLKAMYTRSMIDIEALMANHSSENEGFNEMSRLNTYMLSFLYPDSYKEKTYHVEDDITVNPPKVMDDQKPLIQPIEKPIKETQMRDLNHLPGM